MDEFDVRKVMDFTSPEGVRKLTVETSQAVCSMRIEIAVKDDVIQSARFVGGCGGNTQGVSALIQGMKVEDAIARLDGIDCGGRGTSCPDQLARALKLL